MTKTIDQATVSMPICHIIFELLTTIVSCAKLALGNDAALIVAVDENLSTKHGPDGLVLRGMHFRHSQRAQTSCQ